MDLAHGNIDLKRLRTFVAVVDEGGFARAAVHLALAQPAVSRRIKELEERIGCALIERGRAGVATTPAGARLLEGARILLGDAARLEAEVRALARGERGRLAVGFNETVSWGSIIPASAAAFRARYPDVAMVPEPMRSLPQIKALHGGGLDAGFLFHRDADDAALDGMIVMEDTLLLALPPGSPWALHPPLRLTDLRGETFVWIPREVAPGYHDRVLAHCRNAGLELHVVQEAMDGSALLGLVAEGMGMSFVPAAARPRCPREVTLVPVGDLDIVLRLELVWRRDNASQSLARFREMVAEAPARPSGTAYGAAISVTM